MYSFVIWTVMALVFVQHITVYYLIQKYVWGSEHFWKEILSIPFLLLNMGMVLIAGRATIVFFLGDVYA